MKMGAGYIMINNSGADNDFNDWENSYREKGSRGLSKQVLIFQINGTPTNKMLMVTTA